MNYILTIKSAMGSVSDIFVTEDSEAAARARGSRYGCSVLAIREASASEWSRMLDAADEVSRLIEIEEGVRHYNT
jgi:hypothetical protein